MRTSAPAQEPPCALRALREASLDMAEPPVLLASHPRIDDRIATLDAVAAERGWPTDGPRSAR